MIMQEMHFLRHKNLTSKQGAARGGSNQTGFSDGGIQSNRSKGNQVSSPTKARELMQGALRGALLLVVSSKELTPEGLELILRAQEGVVLMVLTP